MDRIDTVAVTRRAFCLLRDRRRALLPLAGWFALGFLLANAARWRFPGLYVFDPFDQGWLLAPEALWFGPLLALTHHRLLDPGQAFARSTGHRLLKFAKAAAYAYVLAVLYLVGLFAATQGFPALAGYVLGPAIARFYPLLVVAGAMFLLFWYVRLLFPFAFLAGDAREPMIRSILLAKGNARKIVACLLLPAAAVLIPWMALAAFAGAWLDPARGAPLGSVAVFVRSALQAAGAILLSTGLCATYEALVALKGDAESLA
ncbi:hypothetical protein [Pseudodesulfovibrio sp.]|uniref:hypothetical protein n=1 Tax=Pseudodesulfovibrio sp. TaxID=2035812 RepID=UPI00262C0D93|nr:hypothetical protein [Pseudodesulfovibrio sp.]MDD3313075.1 hypothetical protein [Pseudodesulfovibrio sp.]